MTLEATAAARCTLHVLAHCAHWPPPNPLEYRLVAAWACCMAAAPSRLCHRCPSPQSISDCGCRTEKSTPSRGPCDGRRCACERGPFALPDRPGCRSRTQNDGVGQRWAAFPSAPSIRCSHIFRSLKRQHAPPFLLLPGACEQSALLTLHPAAVSSRPSQTSLLHPFAMHLMYCDKCAKYTLKVSVASHRAITFAIRSLRCPLTRCAVLRCVCGPSRCCTVQKACDCTHPTRSAHPARFSPDDKFSKERVTLKKRFNILPTQLAPIKY